MQKIKQISESILSKINKFLDSTAFQMTLLFTKLTFQALRDLRVYGPVVA